MFRGSVNPYDDLVAKTTDENLTGENWELILNLCDKVTDEGEAGARNVMAAVLKRMTHRNPNVQLYSLALVEALSKNCGLQINREIASRSFTQGLERIVTDRTTHDKVKKRTLALIMQWAGEFENDPSLGVMEECYLGLKAKNFKFEGVVEAPPLPVDDGLRRKEEEELQRVLELSIHDKGGRDKWLGGGGYVPSAGAGSSRNASSSNLPSSSGPSASSATAPSTSTPPYIAPSKPTASIAKKHSPAPSQSGPSHSAYQPQRSNAVTAAPVTQAIVKDPAPAQVQPASPKPTGEPVVTRVRALHHFEPTELGELAFEKGDVIKVVDRSFKDWWRGQLKGKTGIFPVNYVEPLPEPTAAEIAKENAMETDVFSQAANIDKLLAMLRGLDPQKDNLADNDELQDLYRQSMSLRPKIVKLIDKYTQKRMELQSMNDNFKSARQMFETMMEESVAKHTPGAMYDYQARFGYDATRAQSTYGWNPNMPGQYAGYPQQGPTPGPYSQNPTPAPVQDYVQPYGPAPVVDPHSAYAQQMGYQYGQQPPQAQQQQAPVPQGPPAVYQPQGDPQQPIPGQAQPQHAQGQGAQAQQRYSTYQQYPQYATGVDQQQQQPQQPQYQQPQQQPQQQQPVPVQQQPQQATPGPQGFEVYQHGSQQPQAQPQQGLPAYGGPQQPSVVTQVNPQIQASTSPLSPHPATSGAVPQIQVQPTSPLSADQPSQLQGQMQPMPNQMQPQATQLAEQAHVEPIQHVHEEQPQQQQAQPGSAGQLVWSPTGQYADPGAQAWAQYYAMGGVDPAGRVYFTPESLPQEGHPYVPHGGPPGATGGGDPGQANPVSVGG